MIMAKEKEVKKNKRTGRIPADERRKFLARQKKENTVGYRMVKARMDRGMSQEQVSEYTGISQSAITHYENDFRLPSDKNKRILSSFYGVSVQELFFD